MFTTTDKIHAFIVMTLLFIVMPTCHADSINPEDYQILDLGYLSNHKESVTAYAINDKSQIVGVSTDSKGNQTAFIFNAIKDSETGTWSGTMSKVDSSSSQSTAYDINNSGAIVGDRTYTTTEGSGRWKRKVTVTTSYISQNGVTTDIATNGTAYAINDNGDVVGTVDNEGYVWNSTEGLTSIGYWSQSAVSINNSQDIVGQTIFGSGYILDTSTGTLLVGSNLEMVDINNNGDSIATYTDRSGTTYSYYISDGVATLITGEGLSSSSSLTVLSMNDSGVVVGTYNGKAFMWDSVNGFVDLSSLLPSDTDWDYLSEATDINNLGQIVGWGYINGKIRSFLLTRVVTPEGSIFILLFISGTVLLVHYRRRPQAQPKA